VATGKQTRALREGRVRVGVGEMRHWTSQIAVVISGSTPARHYGATRCLSFSLSLWALHRPDRNRAPLGTSRHNCEHRAGSFVLSALSLHASDIGSSECPQGAKLRFQTTQRRWRWSDGHGVPCEHIGPMKGRKVAALRRCSCRGWTMRRSPLAKRVSKDGSPVHPSRPHRPEGGRRDAASQ
jgi:hypothetical protein